MYRPQHYADTTQGKKVMSNTTKKEKVAVAPSVIAEQIVTAGKALGYVTKEFGKGSFVISVKDSYVQFLSKLPKDKDCSAEARLFRGLVKGVEGLVNGDSKQTWVIHRNGSLGHYGKFAS
jgi:hypothetical protein